MSEKPHDLTLDILRQMQEAFAHMHNRLDRIESIMRKQRRDSAGMPVLMRATAGDFDEHVSEVEERVAALEARKS